MLEAHTITGAGDMWARVVARSNTDLQRVIDLVLKDPAIVRSSTVIALATQVPYRVLPLARVEAREPSAEPGGHLGGGRGRDQRRDPLGVEGRRRA